VWSELQPERLLFQKLVTLPFFRRFQDDGQLLNSFDKLWFLRREKEWGLPFLCIDLIYHNVTVSNRREGPFQTPFPSPMGRVKRRYNLMLREGLLMPGIKGLILFREVVKSA
jgi:hypothetical protein